MDTVHFHGKTYTADTLNLLQTRELLDLYNRLADKPVSRFASRATGVI